MDAFIPCSSSRSRAKTTEYVIVPAATIYRERHRMIRCSVLGHLQHAMRRWTALWCTASFALAVSLWNIHVFWKNQDENPFGAQPAKIMLNKDKSMKPLEEYLQDYTLPDMPDSECHQNSSLLPNKALSYLPQNLDTPCSTGEEKCVISFAIFCNAVRHSLGSDPKCLKYTSHLKLLRNWHELFRGWQIWLYTDGSIETSNLDSFVRVIVVNASLRGDGTWGSMWRLLPLWDTSSIDRFLMRDVDSIPMVRDWAITYEWIRLGHSSLRWADHSHHYSHPILAGALGLTTPGFSLEKKRELYQKLFHDTSRIMSSKYGDQDWIEHHLWPLLRDSILSFDVVSCQNFTNAQPFPVPHSACDWIMGGSMNMFGRRETVAMECRHPQHLSLWKWG